MADINTEDLVEIQKLEQKLQVSNLPEELKAKAMDMIQRLKRAVNQGGYSQEFEPVSNYIDMIVQIPFTQVSQDNLDFDKVRQLLDKNHYGLDDTKQRLLEYIAILKLNTEKEIAQNQAGDMKTLRGSSANAPILCFVGIQGVGKTSMAKSIAEALGRQFYRISLGGMTNSAALKGVSRAEAAAEPGQVVKGLVRCKVMNPLILLDEVDKVSEKGGTRSDIMAALLEILDPEQNSAFIDNYLDYPIDLSKVMFITTANNLGTISAALQDRLEIIRFSSYSDDDKIHIGIHYMLPKVLKNAGLPDGTIVIEDAVWPLLVRPLGFDAGIRELERSITRLVRKVAMMYVQHTAQKVVITPQNFREFIPEDFGVVS